MSTARSVLIAFTLAAACIWAGQAFAHAANVQLSPVRGVELRAAYDNGEPMIAAQVRIFAPDAPSQVWAQGLTDHKGVFRFVPDPVIQGGWAVQVRQAGHGAMSEIRVESGEVSGSTGSLPLPTSSSGPDWLQKMVMAVAILWGFVGTALYFKRPGSRSRHD